MNPANPRAHFETTGPEIWEDTDSKVDYLSRVSAPAAPSPARANSSSRRIRLKGCRSRGRRRLPCCRPAWQDRIKIQGIGAGFSPGRAGYEVYDEIIPRRQRRCLPDRQGIPDAARACWSVFPPALPSGRQSSWQSAPEKCRQNHRCAAAGHRRPLSVHPAVCRLNQTKQHANRRAQAVPARASFENVQER